MSNLVKESPLNGAYQKLGAECGSLGLWRMAKNFGDAAAEQEALRSGVILSDWSCLSKVSLRGAAADSLVSSQFSVTEGPAPMSSLLIQDSLILRLTQDEFLVLSDPDTDSAYRGVQELESRCSIVDATGMYACFALSGPRKGEVLERSSACDLRQNSLKPGRVLTTTIHRVRCIVFRSENFDLLIHDRSLSEFLFDALLDVGRGVGLLPTGLSVFPISLGGSSDVS